VPSKATILTTETTETKTEKNINNQKPIGFCASCSDCLSFQREFPTLFPFVPSQLQANPNSQLQPEKSGVKASPSSLICYTDSKEFSSVDELLLPKPVKVAFLKFSTAVDYAETVFDMFVPKQDRNQKIVADIVFVHGLGSDPFGAWTNKATNVFWPRDWLAEDFGRKVSILSVGYNNSQTGKVIDLNDQASNVLTNLTSSRVGTRPVIFIAHSMGGLLSKQLYLASKKADDENKKRISQNTAGFIFYGTPHFGAKLAVFLSILPGISNAVEKLADQRTLQSLHDQFMNEIKNKTETILNGVCFVFDLVHELVMKRLKSFLVSKLLDSI